MTPGIVDISGKSYIGRVTNGALIMAERDLGKPVAQALKDSPGLGTIAAIARYTLHHADCPDRILSGDDWAEILNSDDIVGFTNACTMIAELLTASGKNREGSGKN